MIIVIIEYVFLNSKLNEIDDILNFTIVEHKKYGDNYSRKNKFKCNIEIFDKIKNKTKNITNNH